MSDTTADFKTAVAEFGQIFHEADERLQKELWRLFVRGYRGGYRNTRKVLDDPDDVQFYHKTVELLMWCQHTLEKEIKKANQKDAALNFGRVMGRLFAVFCFSLAQPRFGKYVSDAPKQGWVLTKLKDISTTLTELNKKIDKKQIDRRLRILAKEHAGELTPPHKEFLAKAAALFL